MKNSKQSHDNRPPRGGNRVAQWLADTALRLSGWNIVGDIPQHPKMVIAVAPHTSNWDFFLGLAVLFSLRIKIKFLGKHSIFVPVAKQFLEAIGGIPVERSTAHGVVDQIVAKFNAHDKMILALAPEGTRSQIFPWKTGFLAIAHRAQVPVVPIGFDFAQKKVVIGAPFYCRSDADNTADSTFDSNANKNKAHKNDSEDDFSEEMQRIYDFFEPMTPKRPGKTLYMPGDIK